MPASLFDLLSIQVSAADLEIEERVLLGQSVETHGGKVHQCKHGFKRVIQSSLGK
jgi:hypothetical protein